MNNNPLFETFDNSLRCLQLELELYKVKASIVNESSLSIIYMRKNTCTDVNGKIKLACLEKVSYSLFVFTKHISQL